MYCIVLYFIVLYCIALHCIVLYCIVVAKVVDGKSDNMALCGEGKQITADNCVGRWVLFPWT